MTVLQRIQREPVLITGVVTTGMGLAVLLGLDPKISGGIVLFVGAIITLVLRAVVTPAAEVVVQQKPDGQVVSRYDNPESAVLFDSDDVPIKTIGRRRDETGAVSLAALLVVFAVLIIVLPFVALLLNRP